MPVDPVLDLEELAGPGDSGIVAHGGAAGSSFSIKAPETARKSIARREVALGADESKLRGRGLLPDEDREGIVSDLRDSLDYLQTGP